MNKIEHWSRKNCFLSAGTRPNLKSCRCLNSLHGNNEQKRCAADCILFFGKLDKGGRLIIAIEKLKILNDVLKKEKKPFMLTFVASQDVWTNKFLKNVFLCKEALGVLFGIGCKGLLTLIKHTVHHTLSIHGSTETIPQVIAKFRENVGPQLTYFIKNQILPMAGARPA